MSNWQAVLVQQWLQLQQQAPGLRLYGLIDAAQDTRLHAGLVTDATDSCLFAEHIGDDISRHGPHLIALNSPEPSGQLTASPQWALIEQIATVKPGIQLIASSWPYAQVLAALRQACQVRLPDGETMVLAIWDPAILATLVGCAGDSSLHVPGPALTQRQTRALLKPARAWWYWNRLGQLMALTLPPTLPTDPLGAEPLAGIDAPPFELAQVQVDILVEASVPDHLLQHLRLNHPQLLHAIPEEQHYARVEQHLLQARQHGLRGMRDLLNFICAAIVLGPRFGNDPEVLRVLTQVKNQTLSMSEAMHAFPP